MEISKLAVDALFLVNRSTEQLTKLLKNTSNTSKISKPVLKYPINVVPPPPTPPLTSLTSSFCVWLFLILHKYILHTLCSRHPTLVWSDSELLSLLIERYPQQIQQLVGSLGIFIFVCVSFLSFFFFFFVL